MYKRVISKQIYDSELGEIEVFIETKYLFGIKLYELIQNLYLEPIEEDKSGNFKVKGFAQHIENTMIMSGEILKYKGEE